MKFLLLEAEYYGIEGMVETIRAEIESKEAFDAHMRKHWEEQNCIQQCCQNYLSQIANYTSRQVEEQRMINYNHPGKFLTMSTELNRVLRNKIPNIRQLAFPKSTLFQQISYSN